MSSVKTRRWVKAALPLTVACSWLYAATPMPAEPETLPDDLKLNQNEVSEAEALSYFAWGLLLQMASDKDFDAAADQYVEALKRSPDSTPILEHLIAPYLMQKRFDRVVERLRPIAEQHPAIPRLNLLYAEALQQQNLTDEAIEHIHGSLEASDWSEPELLRELFVMLWQHKRYDDAEDLLRQASRKPGLRDHFVIDHARAIFYNALRLTERSQDEGERYRERLRRRAVKYARRAAGNVLQADRVTDIQSLAGLLMEQDDYETVVSMLEQVRQENTLENPALIMTEADALMQLERHDQAARLLDPLFGQPGLRPQFLPELGRMYSELEVFDRAAMAYERALVAFPDAVPLRLQLAYVALRLQQPQKGLAALLPVKVLPPGGLRLMAHLYRQLGRSDKAFESLGFAEKAAAEARDQSFFSVDFHLFYATVSEDLGEHEKAVEQARKALALDPEDPVTCNFLGYVLADQNTNLEEAAALILRALEAEPEDDAYLDSLAWVRYRQGRFAEAHQAMNKAIRFGHADVDAVILDHAGDICQALGLDLMARWYWQESLRKGPPNRDEVRGKLGLTDAAAD